MPDDQPMEVELKLVATAEAMATLLASPLLREHARSTVRSRNLVTTYYDTNDHRLSRRGLAFRVRQSGQAIRPDPEDGERRGRVPRPRGASGRSRCRMATPQLTAFNDPRVLDLTGLVLPDELVPTFETRFKRQAVLVEWPDANRQPAQIEVAFDRGAIRADGSETPICEIELELKRGEPRALFELAQSLRALAPVRLQPLDKAARGYGLVTGRRRPGARPRRRARTRRCPSRTRCSASLAAACGTGSRTRPPPATRVIPRGCTRSVWPCAACARRWRLFKTALGEPGARRLERRICAGCWDRLGPARDLDVFATETMVPVREAPRRTIRPWRCWRNWSIDARWKAHQTRSRDAGVRALRGLAFGLACWVACRGWRQGADIDVLLAQRATGPRLRRRDPDQAAPAGAQARPQLRRARTPQPVTSCGSCSRSSATAPSSSPRCSPAASSTATAAAASRMQDLLGHLNDVAVAQHVVDDLLAASSPGPGSARRHWAPARCSGWYAHAARELEPRAVEAWEEFRAAEPFWPQTRASG